MAPTKTVLDDPNDNLRDYEIELVERVREHGWQTTSVLGGEEPAFSYTTGFWFTLERPELIVFDFPPQLAHDVFGQTMRELRSGRELPMRVPLSGILAGEDVYLFPVSRAAADQYLLSSRWFYKGSEFPTAQLVWSDQQGRFPWQEGFDEALAIRQPDLSELGWLSELQQ
jgi:Domain of unknown function (DUF4262)